MFTEENPITLVKRVCKKIYVEEGTTLFSAQYLVNMYGLTEPEDIDCICNAFTFLAAQGYFTIEADIFDRDGNQVWGGDPTKHQIEINLENCFVQVSFLITDKLKNETFQ